MHTAVNDTFLHRKRISPRKLFLAQGKVFSRAVFNPPRVGLAASNFPDQKMNFLEMETNFLEIFEMEMNFPDQEMNFPEIEINCGREWAGHVFLVQKWGLETVS